MKTEKLIKKLKVAFPYLRMLNEIYIRGSSEDDKLPEIELDWDDIIRILDENNLEIKEKSL